MYSDYLKVAMDDVARDKVSGTVRYPQTDEETVFWSVLAMNLQKMNENWLQINYQGVSVQSVTFDETAPLKLYQLYEQCLILEHLLSTGMCDTNNAELIAALMAVDAVEAHYTMHFGALMYHVTVIDEDCLRAVYECLLCIII